VKLFVQPEDGVAPVIEAIQRAKKTIKILIFRFDRRDIEKALLAAVNRGVAVSALIAYTNRGGEKYLRDLELRLLGAGVTVARTDDDLLRYHGKMMIVDQAELLVLAFNFTMNDIDRSRSFGVSVTNPALIREATELFDADSHRRPYTPGNSDFIVSPLNARRELEAYIGKANRELLIYDPHVGDTDMVRHLEERAKAGVSVRIIGRLTRKAAQIEARPLTSMRLHTRLILRDSEWLFIGSQSLRTAELDARREVGVILHDAEAAKTVARVFENDWAATLTARSEATDEEAPPAARVAKKVAKAVMKSLPPVAPALEVAVRKVVGHEVDVTLNPDELEDTVKKAVTQAVRDVVHDLVEEVVEPVDTLDPVKEKASYRKKGPRARLS
jgi:cardiolipin synthase